MALNMESLSLEEDDAGLQMRRGPPAGSNQSGVTEDVRLCLAGRFTTNRSIRVHIMKERMADVWRPVRGVSIKEASPGVFLFQFFHRLDMEKVIKGGPWTFDNHVLALGKMQMGVPLQQISLNHVDFWVQCHNLPIGFMSELVGKHLANYIGEFVDYDPSNNSCVWRAYMRLRVRIDVTKPLKKNRRVRMEGEDWRVVSFKYEKLTNFCFVCGLIGHVEQNCEVLFAKEIDDGVREWGPELKADNRRGGRGIRSRWLRSDRQGESPNSGGGGTPNNPSFTRNDGHGADYAQRNQSQAQYVHDDGANHNDAIIGERGNPNRIQSNTVPSNSNSGYPASGPMVVYHVPYSAGPSADEAKSEKKRRRDDKRPMVHDDVMHDHSLRDFTITDNPLAATSTDAYTSPFLLAGPGSQACHDQ